MCLLKRAYFYNINFDGRKQMSDPKTRQCSMRRSPRGERQWSVATRQAKLIIITGNALRVWVSQGVTLRQHARSGLRLQILWREYGKSIRATKLDLFSVAFRKTLQFSVYRIQREPSQTPVWKCSRVLLAQIESIVCANNKLLCPEAN